MEVKINWDEQDFEKMGWNTCPIYNISLPQNNQYLTFDIDYIFEWILNKQTNLFRFQVSPCILRFKNVLDLNIMLDFSDSIGLNIEDIIRKNPKLSPNGKFLIWTFVITTDKGEISFTSTGFDQRVQKQPVLSDSYSIGR